MVNSANGSQTDHGLRAQLESANEGGRKSNRDIGSLTGQSNLGGGFQGLSG